MTEAQIVIAAAIFVQAFLGHLIGDYLLQTKWMAITKSKRGFKGAIACTIHVVLYTASICLVLQNFTLLCWLLVAMPHWIIVRYSLAELWLKLIRGRTGMDAYQSEGQMRAFNISFYSVVYTVVDNTFHLLCLWLMIIHFLV